MQDDCDKLDGDIADLKADLVQLEIYKGKTIACKESMSNVLVCRVHALRSLGEHGKPFRGNAVVAGKSRDGMDHRQSLASFQTKQREERERLEKELALLRAAVKEKQRQVAMQEMSQEQARSLFIELEEA